MIHLAIFSYLLMCVYFIWRDRASVLVLSGKTSFLFLVTWFYNHGLKSIHILVLMLFFLIYFSQIRKTCSVATPQGCGRLLIRMLLQRNLLDFPVKLLQNNPHVAAKFYEPSVSVLGSEILVQIFCSLVSEISRISFALNLENTEFLDETWKLPVFRSYEFVPCK